MSIKSIENRPILGYGYMAFWGQHQQLAYRIRENSNWLTAPHSHDGYIEICLALGLVGFTCLIIIYLRIGSQAYRYLKGNRITLSRAPAIYLFFFIIYQFTESSLIGGNSIFWFMFNVVSFHLAAESRSREAVDVPVTSPRQQSFAGGLAAHEGYIA
jgi:O-antigen ligase